MPQEIKAATVLIVKGNIHACNGLLNKTEDSVSNYINIYSIVTA